MNEIIERQNQLLVGNLCWKRQPSATSRACRCSTKRYQDHKLPPLDSWIALSRYEFKLPLFVASVVANIVTI